MKKIIFASLLILLIPHTSLANDCRFNSFGELAKWGKATFWSKDWSHQYEACGVFNLSSEEQFIFNNRYLLEPNHPVFRKSTKSSASSFSKQSSKTSSFEKCKNSGKSIEKCIYEDIEALKKSSSPPPTKSCVDWIDNGMIGKSPCPDEGRSILEAIENQGSSQDSSLHANPGNSKASTRNESNSQCIKFNNKGNRCTIEVSSAGAKLVTGINGPTPLHSWIAKNTCDEKMGFHFGFSGKINSLRHLGPGKSTKVSCQENSRRCPPNFVYKISCR